VPFFDSCLGPAAEMFDGWELTKVLGSRFRLCFVSEVDVLA